MSHLNSLVLVVMLFGFSACSNLIQTSEDKKTCALANGNMSPNWICSPDLAGGIPAVGIEQANIEDEDLQEPQALLIAKNVLKKRIALKVKKIFVNFSQFTGLGKDSVLKTMTEKVSENTQAKLISLSKTKALWNDPSNQDMYMLIKIEPIDAIRIIKFEITLQLKKNKKLWKQIKAEEALVILHREIQNILGQLSQL